MSVEKFSKAMPMIGAYDDYADYQKPERVGVAKRFEYGRGEVTFRLLKHSSANYARLEFTLSFERYMDCKNVWDQISEYRYTACLFASQSERRKMLRLESAADVIALWARFDERISLLTKEASR